MRTAAGSTDTSSPPDAPADSTRSEEDGLPDTSHISKEKERERERGEDSILNPLLQPSQGPEPDPLSVAEAADRPVSAE